LAIEIKDPIFNKFIIEDIPAILVEDYITDFFEAV